MTDYISTHTGAEIDAAVSAVIAKESNWDAAPSVDEMNTAIANAIGAAIEGSY